MIIYRLLTVNLKYILYVKKHLFWILIQYNLYILKNIHFFL